MATQTDPDPFSSYKAIQRQAWGLFAPLEVLTIQPAGLLVACARITKGQKVLDVGCGTGVAAITAARQGAEVCGIDLSPDLIELAKQHTSVARVEVELREGDAEALPYKDQQFDCVISQFGHMFTPRPQVVTAEMLRVLRPGGTLAFATWPPELFTGKMFALVSRYMPPPQGVASPPQWGDPSVVRERLGESVKDLFFDRALLSSPVLSIEHVLNSFESTAGPLVKLREKLSLEDPAALERFREEFRDLIKSYVSLNTLHQHFLLTRAVKK